MILNTLKKIIHHLLIPLVAISLFRPTIAETRLSGNEDFDLGDEYKNAAGELESWFRKDITDPEKKQRAPEPNLGYYFDNLTFKDVYELQYSGNIGVIVSGNRSWNEDPVLQREDIVTKINGVTVKHRSHLDDIIDAAEIGDTLMVEYIRHNEIHTRRIPVYSDKSSWDDAWPKRKTAKKSRGLGGAAYREMYVGADLNDMNLLFTSLDFEELSELNNLYHGFDLQFLIGNGVFLGGYGAWTGQKQNISALVNNQSVPVYRNLQYNSSYGGFTIDRRYRISDKIILSAGVMFGGGNTRFQIEQVENDIDWNQMDTDTSGSYNDYLKMKKQYLLCQPRVSVMYRVLPVFWIKIEAGYSLSYSKNGWQQIFNDNKHDITEPGKSGSLNGLTVSISPWFGF